MRGVAGATLRCMHDGAAEQSVAFSCTHRVHYMLSCMARTRPRSVVPPGIHLWIGVVLVTDLLTVHAGHEPVMQQYRSGTTQLSTTPMPEGDIGEEIRSVHRKRILLHQCLGGDMCLREEK